MQWIVTRIKKKLHAMDGCQYSQIPACSSLNSQSLCAVTDAQNSQADVCSVWLSDLINPCMQCAMV